LACPRVYLVFEENYYKWETLFKKRFEKKEFETKKMFFFTKPEEKKKVRKK